MHPMVEEGDVGDPGAAVEAINLLWVFFAVQNIKVGIRIHS